MLAQRLPVWRNIRFALFRKNKVKFDKMAQVEAGLAALHTVVGEDHQRVVFGNRIGEGLLIGKQFSGFAHR